MTEHYAIHEKADQSRRQSWVMADHDEIAYNTEYSEAHLYVLNGKAVDVVKIPQNNVAHSEILHGWEKVFLCPYNTLPVITKDS